MTGSARGMRVIPGGIAVIIVLIITVAGITGHTGATGIRIITGLTTTRFMPIPTITDRGTIATATVTTTMITIA